MNKKHIAIIGSGPAGLMAADVLSEFHEVSIYEKEKGPGQKFLIAGQGGLNISNAIDGLELAAKYTPMAFMRDAILDFGSSDVRKWLSEMGISTYVGSSGKVFPEKGITPADVLNKIRSKLVNQGVKFNLKHEFTGFSDDGGLLIKEADKSFELKADAYIFALGGASWPVTGSDGEWSSKFEDIGICTLPFVPSNCGIDIAWPDSVRSFHAGKPLKNIQVSINNKTEKGEVLITDYGLEGNAIYPIVPMIRETLKEGHSVNICIDFKPFNAEEQLLQKIVGKTVITTKRYSEIFNLDSVQLAIIKTYMPKETFLSPVLFAKGLKQITLPIKSLRPIAEAISSVGGIPIDELNENFSFRKRPDCFAIGEMVDWDAPTGGFLLQGCFAMGHWMGKRFVHD